MKLSLLIPTHMSVATIERTLESALAQSHRPLEVLVYDEASDDGTREIITRCLEQAPDDIEQELITSDQNSGPVRAWRVALHRASGDWCAFVWADDVLKPTYSEKMMGAAERAEAAGRKLVSCVGEVEIGGEVRHIFASDRGVATGPEFSEGMFQRRFPLTQICAVYEREAAREVFDRHVDIDNPLGYDYSRQAYGNDVGYLSELAHAGGGVELLGEELVTLTDSPTSMTRLATGSHLWQMRWQYTYAFLRVWQEWQRQGVPGADRLVALASRRLALCAIMLRRGAGRLAPRRLAGAVGAYIDFLRFDYQKTGMTLDDHREKLRRLGATT
jgi:glycosyltransferase involved in cell wall biosynthesis